VMRRSYPTPPRPCLMRAEHVNPDRVRAVSWRPGRPTVRRVEFSGGNRMSKKVRHEVPDSEWIYQGGGRVSSKV